MIENSVILSFVKKNYYQLLVNLVKVLSFEFISKGWHWRMPLIQLWQLKLFK